MAGFEDVVAWLRSLPRDCELAWSDDALSVGGGFGYGFVDAYVPLLAEQLGWNWIWSIFPPESMPAEQPELGLVEILVEVEGVDGWEEVSRTGDPLELARELGIDSSLLAEASAAVGERAPSALDLSLPYDATLEAVFYGAECLGAHLHRDDGTVAEVAVDYLDVQGLAGGQARETRRWGKVSLRSRRVWTVACLDRALTEWAQARASRGDLRFVCRDGIDCSPLMRVVRGRIEEG